VLKKFYLNAIPQAEAKLWWDILPSQRREKRSRGKGRKLAATH